MEQAYLSVRGRGGSKCSQQGWHIWAQSMAKRRLEAWKELSEQSSESGETPPSAVGVLLASEVSEPGSSDPSSAGVCRGDSGTYIVSPSEWLPLLPPLLTSGRIQEQCLLELESTSMDGPWPCDKITRGTSPIPSPTQLHSYTRATRQRCGSCVALG